MFTCIYYKHRGHNDRNGKEYKHKRHVDHNVEKYKLRDVLSETENKTTLGTRCSKPKIMQT